MTDEQAAAMLAKLDEINGQLIEIKGSQATATVSLGQLEGAAFPQVREMASFGCGLLFALLLALGLDRLFPR